MKLSLIEELALLRAIGGRPLGTGEVEILGELHRTLCTRERVRLIIDAALISAQRVDPGP